MTQRLPAFTPKEVIRRLQRVGFFVHHVTGGHYVLKHPEKTSLRVVVPWHGKDLKRGTLRSILENADLTHAEFLNL